MGFCRRCGDIVVGVRCKCGGVPVAPVLAWERFNDKWSKTYVSPQKQSKERVATDSTPSSRFPRPKSMTSNPVRPTFAISRQLSPSRPTSPLKISTILPDEQNDILPSHNSSQHTLSKVYGSVLQPKETLPLHSCAICATIFPPDATIYPNPSASTEEKTFVCRQCFTVSGGSKGSCFSCSRPVLSLKSEGGFVQSDGKYWHKQCFNCSGCFKNIGDSPMLDLYARPSCQDCFENTFKREPTTPKKAGTSNNNSPSTSNPGGLNTSYGKKSRESSPAIEELEQKFGLVKSREASPAPQDYKLSTPKSPSSSRRLSYTPSASPIQSALNSSSDDLFRQKINYIRPMDQLVSTNSVEEPTTALPSTSSSRRVSLNENTPFNPAASLKSNRSSRSTAPSSPIPATTASLCGICNKHIINPTESGQFMALVGGDENSVPAVYHPECFKCVICNKSFDKEKSQISYVSTDAGVCHKQCAPSEIPGPQPISRTKTLPNLNITSRSIFTGTPSKTDLLIKDSVSQSSLPSPTKTSLPRFGGQNTCPGCQRPVSFMERGVVPGPHGTRWHVLCLVCGGKKETSRNSFLSREVKSKGEPGCGKKLDSAAKIDGEGGVWCRECLLLLGFGGSPQSSPTRPANVPSSITNSTSASIDIEPQMTGSASFMRSGVGGGGTTLKHLTGGGLNPTRSISPTKQLGMTGFGNGNMRPRPKSVVNINEGRGMYLVRQFTGANTNE